MGIRFGSRVPLISLAVLTIVLGIAFLVIWYMNIGVAAKGGHDLSFFAWVATWLFATGIGLGFGSRIAALLLVLPPAITWAWMIIDSLLQGALLAAALQLAASFIFLTPSIVAIGGWHLLGWLRWRAVA